MRNIFSGILAGILILTSVLLLAAAAYSLYIILNEPLPAYDLNYAGLSEWLNYFKFPIISFAVFLYVITLLFTTLRIQQVNDSLVIMKNEILEGDRPRLFLKPLNILFTTNAGMAKLSFNLNGSSSATIQIVNAGKEPALEVKSRFSFDIGSAVKLIKSNDLFHLFEIEDNDKTVSINSGKLGYSSKMDTLLLNNWQKNDFILPSTQNSPASVILVPGVYLEMFYWYNEITNGDKAGEFPALKCHVEYKTVNNSVIKQDFNIKLVDVEYSPGLRGDKLYDSTSKFCTELRLI